MAKLFSREKHLFKWGKHCVVKMFISDKKCGQGWPDLSWQWQHRDESIPAQSLLGPMWPSVARNTPSNISRGKGVFQAVCGVGQNQVSAICFPVCNPAPYNQRGLLPAAPGVVVFFAFCAIPHAHVAVTRVEIELLVSWNWKLGFVCVWEGKSVCLWEGSACVCLHTRGRESLCGSVCAYIYREIHWCLETV